MNGVLPSPGPRAAGPVPVEARQRRGRRLAPRRGPRSTRTRGPAASSAPSASRSRRRRCPRRPSRAAPRPGSRPRRRPRSRRPRGTPPSERLEVPDDAGRVSEWTTSTVRAPLSASARATSLGRRRLAPRVGQRDDVAAERAPELLPALAELALRDDERPLAGREEVDERRLERAGAGGREDEHLVLRAKTWRSRAWASSNTVLKSGERWWITGSASAAAPPAARGSGPG